eukprot:540515_1
MTNIMRNVLLNKEIIAINQQNEFRVGMVIQFIDCDSKVKNACSIWIRQLNKNMSSYAVVLLNLGDDINGHQFGVNFNQINKNWNNKTVLLIRDLWKHEDLGNYIGAFFANVSMHGVSFTTMTQY